MEPPFNQPSPLLQIVDNSIGMSQTSQTKAEVQKLTELVTALDAKVNILLENSDRMRKSSSRTMWITIIFVVIPIALSVFALPFLMNGFLGSVGLGTDQGAIVNNLLQELQKAQQ